MALLLSSWSCRSATFAECDNECDLHATCVFGSAGPECVCVTGYTRRSVNDLESPCDWTGVLSDPEFERESSWETGSVGASIAPLEEGLQGARGLAVFDETAACNGDTLSNVVEMPRYEDAEPLVAEVTFRRRLVAAALGYGSFVEGVPTQTTFRRLQPGFSAQTVYPAWAKDRFCLGPAAYGQTESGRGGPVLFQIGADERPSECVEGPVIEIDRFDILPAREGECPEAGGLLNGSAEVGAGGWFFDVEPGRDGFARGLLEEGVGREGSGAARLYKAPGATKRPGMFTQLSVPLPSSLGSPALRFWWRASVGYQHYVDLGTWPGVKVEFRQLDTLVGNGEWSEATYCLPPWTHGNLVDLSFSIDLPTGDESFDAQAEFVVDDVELVPDLDKCEDNPAVLDPSFDSSPNRWPGVLISSDATESRIRVLDDPGAARSGAGLMEFEYSRSDADMTAEFWVRVPEVPEGTQPQLVFWSSLDSNAGLPTFWVLGDPVTGLIEQCLSEACPAGFPLAQRLESGLGWQRNRVCLPEEWTGRWYKLRIAVRPLEDEPVQVFDEPFRVLLDDFEVGPTDGCTEDDVN